MRPPRGDNGPSILRRLLRLGALVLGAGAVSWPLLAATCSVPGSHADLQEAIDDPVCSTIELQAQTYGESVLVARSLTLAGPSGNPATLQGLLRVTGAGTVVQLADLRIESGCAGTTLRVRGGAQVESTRVAARSSSTLPCPPFPIFNDGFESGDTSAWSSTVGAQTLSAPEAPPGKIRRQP